MFQCELSCFVEFFSVNYFVGGVCFSVKWGVLWSVLKCELSCFVVCVWFSVNRVV